MLISNKLHSFRNFPKQSYRLFPDSTNRDDFNHYICLAKWRSQPMKEYAELENFIRKHYAALYTSALKFVKSEAVAQDIVQEIIIRYWENQEKYNTIESIENFLFVSVKNEALNYLRGIERENNRYARLENPESEEPQIFNLFIEEETNQMLLTAIGQLPEQSAWIIRLALSGLENKEISRLLDVSVNTVKTLKYSAIRKLREHFQKKAI